VGDRLLVKPNTQKSPTQQFTDRFERIFMPVILGLVVLLLFAWLVVAEPFEASFYRAMAVLVAAMLAGVETADVALMSDELHGMKRGVVAARRGLGCCR
jgi:Cd2+/Zn2+-exporting ATPase